MSEITGNDSGGVHETNALQLERNAFRFVTAFIDAGITHVVNAIAPCKHCAAVVTAFILVGKVMDVNILLLKCVAYIVKQASMVGG